MSFAIYASAALAAALLALPASAAPAAVAAEDAGPPLPQPAPLVVVQSKLFNPYVYRAILNLPPSALATPENAALVRKRLLGFLLRAGYTLAKVTATVDEKQIVVEIDEGQLDKILVLGVGAWDGVRFRYDFDLPNGVYNRPLVEERLDQLCQRFGLFRCTKTLIAVGAKEDNGPLGETALGLIEDLGISSSMLPSELDRGARAYELQLLLEPPPRHSSFWPSLDLGAPDGLLVGFGGYLAELPFAGGWIESRARAGGGLRSHIDGSGSSLTLTRAEGEARIRIASLANGLFKPAIGLRTELLARQRGDLGVDGILQGRLEAVLVAELTPKWPALDLGWGAGVMRNVLFNRQLLGTVDPVVAATPSAFSRFFALGFAHWDLSPGELRHDRHQLIDLLGRFRAGPGATLTGGELMADVAYRKYVGFGWHELWIRAHAIGRSGDVLYTDEHILSDDLRGGLSNIWVRRQATLLSEIRYSLFRDLFKVGLFEAVTVYDKVLSRSPLVESPRGALAVGLGLHHLVFTLLTVDFYGTLAWTTDGEFGPGFSLEIHEAYR